MEIKLNAPKAVLDAPWTGTVAQIRIMMDALSPREVSFNDMRLIMIAMQGRIVAELRAVIVEVVGIDG